MAPRKTSKQSKSSSIASSAKSTAKTVSKTEPAVTAEPAARTEAVSTPVIDNTLDKIEEVKKPAAPKAPAKSTTKAARSSSKKTPAKKAPAKKTSPAKAKEAESVIVLNDTTAPVKAEVKEEPKKTPAKSTPKSPAKNKATGKTAAKKSSAPAKSGATQETYFEIGGEQILMEDINEKIRQAWIAEGHFPSRLRTIKTYLNLTERRAYYVINGKAENKYVEF